MTYSDFLARKAIRAAASGIPIPPKLNTALKDHQSLLTRWALRRGRAAIFADTGLGKSFCELEWCRVAADKTARPALILAPLAVSHQFVREGAKFGIDVTPCADQSDVRPGVNVTNYQKLHKFDPQAFGAVALDESSILKSLDGKTRSMLIEAFSKTPFRLAATATPSPNDHAELGGQAEFLGIMRHPEMLATFFVHDAGNTQDWRLKGHAREAFWKFVCSWGAIVKLPSDIGCVDDGYILPPLNYHEHIIPATREDAIKSGMLFAAEAETLTEQRAARRGSLESRVAKCAAIANADKRRGICWVDLNAESEALTAAIPDAIEVTGSLDDDEKERRLDAFIRGDHRVLVSKSSISGWGLNLQFVDWNIFCGVSHSFEGWYQAIRRSHRFGRSGSVDVHVVSSELEGAVVANLKAKMAKAEELSAETRRYASAYVRGAVLGATRETIGYEPREEMKVPSWLK